MRDNRDEIVFETLNLLARSDIVQHCHNADWMMSKLIALM